MNVHGNLKVWATGVACAWASVVAAREGDPARPDLSVQYIARTPRLGGPVYSYEDVDNDEDGLGPIGPGKLTAADGGWPESGAEVVYTATVRNVGGGAAECFEYAWLFDGQAADEGAHRRVLRAGETAQFTLVRRWQEGPHTVAFEIDRHALLPESERGNNLVADRTDALAMTLFVEESVDAYFAEGSVAGYRSFADWAQFQIRRMNGHFRDSRYASCPEGVLERLRLDAIYRIPDGWGEAGGTHAPAVLAPVDRDRPRFVKAGADARRLSAVPFTAATGGCDVVWGFGAEAVTPSAQRGGATYFDERLDRLTGTDWVLFRQVLHQLGRCDHSLLAVDGADNLALPGVGYAGPGGLPDLLRTPPETLGQFAAPPAPVLSEHVAASLNRDHGRRRGFLGEYLRDVPRVNRFRLRLPEGGGAGNARVALFVSKGRSYARPMIRALPSFVGRSDAEGVFQLDRSPWNHVFTWATNGVLMFVVTPESPDDRLPEGQEPPMAAESQESLLQPPASQASTSRAPAMIGWLDLAAFNLEYWRGHTESAEYVVRLAPIPATPAASQPSSAAGESR